MKFAHSTKAVVLAACCLWVVTLGLAFRSTTTMTISFRRNLVGSRIPSTARTSNNSRMPIRSSFAFVSRRFRKYPNVNHPSQFPHRCDPSFSETSAANPLVASSPEGDVKKTKLSSLSVLWRFTRPHTIIGSAIAIPALHLLAAPSCQAAFSVPSLISMVYAMVPALLMNVYITGLNQITDVDIDKINKPDLPIAAGDLSLRSGILTVIISLIASLTMGVGHPVLGSQGLNVALWFSAILGTLYSLPPIRLKRYPFLAAFCIVAVRGAVINAGFFAHAKVAAFGSMTATSSSVWQCLTSDPRCYLSSLYFAIFGVVIALMKDVPDVKGDELSNVRTFSVQLGPKRVYRWMQRLLTSLFWGVGLAFFRGAAVGAANDVWVSGGRFILGLCSTLAAFTVQREAAPVNPENPIEVYQLYMYLWKLFYLSYLVLPLAR